MNKEKQLIQKHSVDLRLIDLWAGPIVQWESHNEPGLALISVMDNTSREVQNGFSVMPGCLSVPHQPKTCIIG